MYELMVLGRLACLPMHGYMIAKILGEMMGPFRRVQWGVLYPLLGRLEQEGLIQAQDGGPEADPRARKVYAITERGSRRLHDLLMDTERHQGDYDTVFAHKVGLFSLLSPEERLYLARHYAVYAHQNVDHLERERRDLLERATPILPAERMGDILTVMDHRLEYWQSEQAWAEQLIERERRQEAV